jgi:hypothetical protein
VFISYSALNTRSTSVSFTCKIFLLISCYMCYFSNQYKYFLILYLLKISSASFMIQYLYCVWWVVWVSSITIIISNYVCMLYEPDVERSAGSSYVCFGKSVHFNWCMPSLFYLSLLENCFIMFCAARQHATAKTTAKWSAYQILIVIVVFLILVFKV